MLRRHSLHQQSRLTLMSAFCERLVLAVRFHASPGHNGVAGETLGSFATGAIASASAVAQPLGRHVHQGGNGTIRHCIHGLSLIRAPAAKRAALLK